MKIFLSTHRHMASGMRSSLEILTGRIASITVFDAHLPESEGTVEQHIEEFLQNCRKDETKLLISDIYGGSVNQSMMKYAERTHTYVIAGINLALLLDLAVTDADYSKEQLQAKIEEARNAIKLCEIETINRHLSNNL